MSLDEAWAGLVDDAAIFPPGNVPLAEASAAFISRTSSEGARLVGSFVVRDTDLPGCDVNGPLSVVCTGGAGQLRGPVEFAKKHGVRIVGLEIAVRDLDDLAGNVRRIGMATDELETEWSTFVELPQTAPDHGWLAAADAVAEAGLMRLKFRTGGVEAWAFPTSEMLASWIDAALDRELQFKCTAGLHRAVRHTGEDGFEHHGYLNILKATLSAFDGASRDEVVGILEDRDLATITVDEVDRARRWFLSFGSCSVDEPWADLRNLGLA